MNQKIYRFVTIVASGLFATLLLFPTQAHASQTTVNVTVGLPLIDVCPNIPGAQPTVPNGMIIDGNGNCVTPPPPIVDVCSNIAGDQSTIPSGYYQDELNNCLPQPSPPVDVCPNLSGVQAVVPSSLVVDEDGNCIAPPIDECPNIEGPQSAIPEGMVRVDSTCFTPTPPPGVGPTEPTPQPPAEQPRSTPVYRNVPTFLAPVLAPVLEPIINIIPEPVKELVKTVPIEVARTVPYYIYAVLGIAAIVMIGQAIREAAAINALLALLKREKNIAEQKDNFIALASHYLRTPLTLMRNGLDTIIALKELPGVDLTPLKAPIDEMDADIKAILTDIESNAALKDINAPTEELKGQSLLRSGYFWGPILGSLTLTLFANFLLGIVADVDLGTANLLFQVIVITAVSIVFYTALRNYKIRNKQKAHQQRLLDHERTVDGARNAFIASSTQALQTGLTKVYGARYLLGNAPSAKFFDDGYLRFNNILDKFLLLSTIQSNSTAVTQKIDVQALVDSVIDGYSEQIAAKKLAVTNAIPRGVSVQQNYALFEFVIKSVIDNAIKFNVDGGSIELAADVASKQIVVHVSDNGVGIPNDKLAQLFKPFSRADSAIQFNYEGLGFSLFLDKIIADYMGGDIQATSAPEKGTKITLRTATVSGI